MRAILLLVSLPVLGTACGQSLVPGLDAVAPLAAVGQASTGDAGAPPCPTDAGTCVPTSPESELDAACPRNRWIAILEQGGSCPTVTGGNGGQWAGAPLFDSAPGGVSLPPALTPFCAYDWVPANAQQPAPPDDVLLTQQLDGRVSRLDRDCQTVAPLGTNGALSAGWMTMLQDFHRQTGWLSSLPASTANPPAEVRVAVVDSAPHGYSGGEAGTARLSHGHVMGRIIRELGCPSGFSSSGSACIAQVANHLALPQLTPTTRDLAQGGYFGLQTQLARALHTAVSDWRSHNALGGSATPQPRLVINLSIAWDGRYGGAYTHPLELPAPVRAVHAALTHAVCRGALVLAAAGNDPGGPLDVTGPMYPAGWETKPAPTASQCAALEGSGYQPGGDYPVFPPAGGGVYQPLVHAAGGVRGDDRPLTKNRPGGRPRLAAPGAHGLAVWVDSTGTTRPTEILTGTSVSTAIASGIAATVWGYRPSLSAPEVMALVRQASVDLGQPADFCLGGLSCPLGPTDPLRSIRRVSLCSAVVTACGGGLERCPAPPALPMCPARPAYAAPLPNLTLAQWAAVDAHVTYSSGASLNVPVEPLAVCRHAALRGSTWSYPDTVCPFRQYFSTPIRPWTNPQPESDPCPLCEATVVSSGSSFAASSTSAPTLTLYLGIDSGYSSVTFTDPSVLLNNQYEIKLTGITSLTGGNELRVVDIPLDPAWPTIHSAALLLKGEEGGVPYSTHSELLVH